MTGDQPTYGPNFPWAKPTPEPTPDPIRPPTSLSKLRIGDRVRSLVDDVNVSAGLEGLIVNVVPPRYRQPSRARVLWDNDTVSMADEPTFEVIGKENPADAVRGLRKDMGASA